MLSSDEISEIIPSRVNLVDADGMITRDWFLFLCDLYISTSSLAGSVNDIALIDNSASHELSADSYNGYAISDAVNDLYSRFDAVEIVPTTIVTDNRDVCGYAASMVEQGAVVSTDNYTVLFEMPLLSQGVDMQSGSMSVLSTGNYLVNYTLLTSGAGELVTWIEVNDVAVNGSLVTSTVPVNSVVDNRSTVMLKSDDVVKVKWSASVPTLKIKGADATATRPSSYSAKIEIRKIQQ